MIRRQKIKYLIQKHGLIPKQFAPILNIDVTYVCVNNTNNKTAVGNFAVAGNRNFIHDNLYVSPPPKGFVKIISPDGQIKQIESADYGNTKGLTREDAYLLLTEKKRELLQLQAYIIELQEYVISLEK